MNTFDNLAHVMPIALANAPCGICYVPGKGWTDYDLCNGAPEGCIPEFLVYAEKELPRPLNEDAEHALISLIRSLFAVKR